MIIRRFSLDDIHKGFLETLKNLAPVGDPPERKLFEVFRNVFGNRAHNIYVAEVDGQVVGTITLIIEQKFIHEGGRVGRIEDVAVKKGWERRGVGNELVKKAIEEARWEKCYKVILDCNEKNVHFYERFGFRRHEIAMRLDLPQKIKTP